MKRLALVSVLSVLAAPAYAGCGQELNCQLASISIETRQPWLEKVEQSRRRSAEFVAKAYSAYLERNPKTALVKFEERALDYLHDPTLRKNDIVVTDEGLLVFKGRAAAQTHYSDFIFVPHAEGEREISRREKPRRS